MAVAVLILLAAGVCSLRVLAIRPSERLLRQAEIALDRGHYERARRLAARALEQTPGSPRALLIAGQAETRLHNDQAALEFFQRVRDDGSSSALRAWYGCGDRLILLGRAARAEQCLRRVLEYEPSHVEANARLVYLLQLEGRNWESMPHLRRLIRQGRFTRDQLLMAISPEAMHVDCSKFIGDCQAAVPGDPVPLLGRARSLLRFHQSRQAEELLRAIVAADPGQSEAQARLGEILLDRDLPDEFLRWHGALPPAADGHPGIWRVRGAWARRHGQLRAAARCFWEAISLDPDHAGANYQLSQVLHALGEEEASRPFLERAGRLGELEAQVVADREGLDALRKIAHMLESLGRDWEAAAWHDIVRRMRPDLKWPRQELLRLRAKLQTDSRAGVAANPALRVNLSSYPLPQWHLPRSDDRQPAPRSSGASRFAFTDSAEAAGLRFDYYNGADPAAGRAYMFEFSGGGAAVVDCDSDGWPDLYLTQGCPWPVRKDQRRYQNRLYRNSADGTFQDITAQSGLGDNGFGQGATVGDYDNDGFPDIYVANIGPNSLYRNNGDGTFSNVTAQSGTAGDQWTTSCLLADLNGDTWPDLYAVNYLAGPEVFERACEHNGKPEQCSPTMFEAEQDRLYLNLGDGKFEDITDRCGIVASGGKGLGVLAADFHGGRRLSLFVANDTTANFFFVNRNQRAGAPPRFVESALFSGLAYDEQGRGQACMGVAADDVNGDGLLDLFVTNFFGEFNTLYVSQGDGLYVDGTRQAKLAEPSFETLGFGTQFLDVELDGLPDLVVANGHVNDLRDEGKPYQMSPEIYRNIGRGQFVRMAPQSLGPYFEGKYLGRALVRLDWNRDGLEDFCVTHVDAPVALLTNRTPQTGHYLAVCLRGTGSARDAIGATVQVTAGGRSWVRQLTAGDGFEVSNQRQLTFGLGSEREIEELIVRWPSGLDQRFQHVAAGGEILVIEGSREIRRLRETVASTGQ